MSNDMLKRVQILQRYMRAMKDGDIETVAMLLEDAEQERALENMVMEVNASYLYENSTPVQQNDIIQAQRLMHTIAHQTTRRDAMQHPVFHAEDDSAQTPAVVTLEQVQSTDSVSVGRNALTPAYPAKGAVKQTWYRSSKGRIVALAAAILIFFVLLQSNGALASQIFSFFFHQEKPIIMNIPVKKGDYVGLDDLGSFSAASGSFASPGSSNMQYNLTKTQAMHAINFPLALPGQLPEDLRSARAGLALSRGGYITFTFSSAKTHAYLTKIGYRNVSIPANLDGATFRMGRPNAIQIYYQNGRYELMISEGAIYNVQATGNALVKDLDDFMLLLPNLSPLVKEEFMQNNGDALEPFPTGTLIKSVTVHHLPGFLVSGKSMGEPMLWWEENGIQYFLSGNMNASQLLAIANSLHS